jgi:hypothetical protein
LSDNLGNTQSTTRSSEPYINIITEAGLHLKSASVKRAGIYTGKFAGNTAPDKTHRSISALKLASFKFAPKNQPLSFRLRNQPRKITTKLGASDFLGKLSVFQIFAADRTPNFRVNAFIAAFETAYHE